MFRNATHRRVRTLDAGAVLGRRKSVGDRCGAGFTPRRSTYGEAEMKTAAPVRGERLVRVSARVRYVPVTRPVVMPEFGRMLRERLLNQRGRGRGARRRPGETSPPVTGLWKEDEMSMSNAGETGTPRVILPARSLRAITTAVSG